MMSDEDNPCVIYEFHNNIGAVCGYAIIGVKGVEQSIQDAALKGRQ